MTVVYEILFAVAVALVFKVIHSIKKAGRDDEIRFLCPQFGFTYLDQIPIADLGELNEPPWTAIQFGLARDTVMQTLIACRPAGRAFSGQFRATFERGRYESASRHSYAFTIVGLTLQDRAAQQHLVDFCGDLNLKNGLHLMVRGDDIYAMFGPRYRRSMVMTYREQMTCMTAMVRMLEGNLARAEALFNELPGASIGFVMFSTASLLGALWLWLWIYCQSEAILMLVVPPAVIFPVCLYTSARRNNDMASLESYLESRAHD